MLTINDMAESADLITYYRGTKEELLKVPVENIDKDAIYIIDGIEYLISGQGILDILNANKIPDVSSDETNDVNDSHILGASAPKKINALSSQVPQNFTNAKTMSKFVTLNELNAKIEDICSKVESGMIRGARGYQGPQGPIGPRGEQGPKGPQGDRGPRGDIGEQGERGPQGVIGTPGIQGRQGFHGTRGDRGPVGEQGPQGPIGPVGEQGPQGEQGTQGVCGEQGPRGVPGMRGVMGYQGPQGAKGTQGELGTQGERGTQGAQGTRGERGPQGYPGKSTNIIGSNIILSDYKETENSIIHTGQDLTTALKNLENYILMLNQLINR